MNNAYLDVLSLRRPPLNYITPAICDAAFSSTSFPTLILNALPVKTAITGLHIRYIGDTGNFELTWDNYPGAICYSVYKLNDANDPLGDYTIIAECITDIPFVPNDWDPDFDPDDDVCYLVTAITATGETAISDPICNDEPPPLPPPPDGGGGGCISNLTPLPDAELGAEYSVTFLPVGPAAGPLWTISGGAVPAGLTLVVGTGVFSGIPTEDGEFDFTVRLTKDGGGFCEKAFHMTVLGCISNPSSLPGAEVGVVYIVNFLPVGVVENPQWTTVSGAVPDGMSLDLNTGELAGIAENFGSFSFRVRLTKDGGFCEKDFTLEVAEAPFDCQGNTTDVASLNWSRALTGNVTGTVAYPDGTFDFPLSLSTTRNIQYLPLSPSFRFCNPTIGRVFTATIAGNFLVSGASTGRITIRINHSEGSVFTSSQSLDFNAAGPFSIQTSIPFNEALAVNTIRFTVTLQEFTGSVGATGTLTTTDTGL